MAYNKFVFWSKEDKAHISVVPSLPGCMSDGETMEECMKNTDVIIQEWIEFAEKIGWDVPPEDF